MHCACTKRPYFHFRCQTWRHDRVPRPRFRTWRENFGYLRIFKADIGLLNIGKGFQDLLAWNGCFGGQNRGRGGVILTSNELVLPFGGSYVCANFGENRSRNATVRVLAVGHTDRQTQTFHLCIKYYRQRFCLLECNIVIWTLRFCEVVDYSTDDITT